MSGSQHDARLLPLHREVAVCRKDFAGPLHIALAVRALVLAGATYDGVTQLATLDGETTFLSEVLCAANIVTNQRIAGLAVWEFGFVLDGFYSQMERKIAPPLEVIATFDSRIHKGDSTRVAGKVLRGDTAVAAARVTVTWISSTGKAKTLGSTRTNERGRYAVAVSPTRSGTLRITATSEGQKATIKRPIMVRP